MGKGSKRRPCCTSTEEENIRWLLYKKRITFDQYRRRYKKLEREGKIYRK